jgi:hypothetical protein
VGLSPWLKKLLGRSPAPSETVDRPEPGAYKTPPVIPPDAAEADEVRQAHLQERIQKQEEDEPPSPPVDPSQRP